MTSPMNSAVQLNNSSASQTQLMDPPNKENSVPSPEPRPSVASVNSLATNETAGHALGGGSVDDIIRNDPKLARALAVLRQRERQEQALQSASASETLPPTSIPNADAGSAAQAQTVHKPNGHIFGKVTIKGKNAKVQQGNVHDSKTNPNLIKVHTYGEVEIEEAAETPNLHQGDFDIPGYRTFLNSGGSLDQGTR